MTAWTAAASTSNWGVAWFADMGPYVGPAAIDPPARPSDAGEVQLWVGHMVGDPATTGAFSGGYATAARWIYLGTEYDSGSDSIAGEGVDLATAHLFVAWLDPDAPSDPADLTPPSVTPDALVPDGYVAAPASASVDFGGLSARVTTSDRPTAALYDTDGSFLCALPLAAGIQWQEELSAVGALSMRLPLDDAATLLATSRRILKVSWRGRERQAARIDSSSTDVAVDGRVWREWSNLPGIMSILGGVTVYPEYGLNRASNTSRTFGYMAKTGHGEWLGSGNWTPAIGVTWAAMTGDRAGMPEGLDFPNPQWIAKRGPNADEPPLSYQYFRRRWTSTAGMNVQILATADNYLDLWLDGDKIVDSAGQHQFTWRDAFQISVHIPPGVHVLAARVRNHKDTTYSTNRMGLLLTMQRVQSNGDVIDEPPFINSDYRWLVSDITPGFRRAEVLYRLWDEGSGYGYTACDLLPLGFSHTYDSAGVAWEEPSGEYTVDVGSSLLDVIAALTEKNIDVNVDPDTLEVQAWVRRGSDKTAAVQLRLGSDGGNLMGHRVDTTEPKYNTIIMQLGDGRWVQRQDAASVAAHGREGGGLAMGSTSSTSTANQTADAQLLEASERSAAFTTQTSSITGPQAYIDYGMGDTITVPDENGTGVYAARVMAITVNAPDDGSPVQVTPELMLDRSATPLAATDGGDGGDDPGDLGSPTTVDTLPDLGAPDTMGGTIVTGPYSPTSWGFGAYGTYEPTASKTGLAGVGVNPVDLTDNTGSTWVITSGGTYDLQRVRRRVVIDTAEEVIFMRSSLELDAFSSGNGGALSAFSSAVGSNPALPRNVKLYDCDVHSATPSIWNNGLSGHGIEAHRCHIYDVVDGFDVQGDNFFIGGCLVDGLTLFSPDPNHSNDQTHNDTIQWFGGVGLVVVGNALWAVLKSGYAAAPLDLAHRNPVAAGGPNNPRAVSGNSSGYNKAYPYQQANSVLQTGKAASLPQCTNLVMTQNFMHGGGLALNIGSGLDYPWLGEIGGNTFAKDYRWAAIGMPAASTGTKVRANVHDNVHTDGTPAKIQGVWTQAATP